MPSALLQKTPYGSFGGQPGGTLAKYQGKDLSTSVMDKEELPLTAEELTRSLAERDAIGPPTVGPISIDPTDWLTPGGLAKVAAVLKGVVAPAATVSTAMLVGSRAAGPTSQLQRSVGASQLGAFRSANDTMLSRKMLDPIKSNLKDVALAARSDDPPYYEIMSSIAGKISDKEVAKYGTPEFKLDKWLHSTRTHNLETPYGISEVTPGDLIAEGRGIIHHNRIKNVLYESDMDPERIAKRVARRNQAILEDPGTKLIEDYNIAKKQGKTLLDASDPWVPKNDIVGGIEALVKSIESHGIDPATLKDKSFQQITSIVNKADDDAVRVLKKSMEAKSQVIARRTEELAASQPDIAAHGFVKLTDSTDLAQETDILNHCIGAVGRDNDKYIPAFDTVTGQMSKKSSSGSSFEQYNDALARGTSEFYSYRPKGTPEVTLEVDKTGNLSNSPIIKQAYGKDDAPLTKAQNEAVIQFTKAKGIEYSPWRWTENFGQ